MTDIVPELYADIKKEFYAYMDHDNRIQKVLSGKDQRATLADVSKLSTKVGRYASIALEHHFTDENLPNSKLYYNIAERTIVPLMKEVHTVINDMAIAVQKNEDKKQGIGIKPIRSRFPEERIMHIVYKVSKLSLGEDVDD